MYGLDLFSGIGGLTIALEGYVRPIAYCENDRYAQAVLLSRMAGGDLSIAPIWDDVRTLDGKSFTTSVDIIYGGFPCQDISVAGRGEGLGGERSGLFFEIARLAGEIRPRFIFLENVPAIRIRGADVVVKELAGLGYDCRWITLSAAEIGANHKRERWFLLAHAGYGSGRHIGPPETGQDTPQKRRGDHDAPGRSGEQSETLADSDRSGFGKRRRSQHVQAELDSIECAGEDAPDANSRMRTGLRREGSGQERKSGDACWWESEPNVGRVAHGIPFRVDRLRAMGNSVVPAQAREAFERLMGVKF